MAAIQCHANERPDQRALIFLNAEGQEQTVATFGEVYADIRKTAWAWSEQGVQPGNVVLLALDHSYYLVTGFLGAIAFGVVPVILPYPRPKALDTYLDQLEVLIRHTEAAAVFATPAVTELAQERLAGLNCQVHAFGLGESEMPPQGFSVYDRDDDEALYLQLTSGTTGVPKLAVLSQKAVMLNIKRTIDARYQKAGSVVGCMPFSHDAGLVFCLLVSLVMGRLSVHIKPTDWVARPELLWIAVTVYRGGTTFLPNFALNFMARRISHPQPEEYNLESLHTIIVAAELITQESLQVFYGRFGRCGLKEKALCSIYGMAEQVCGISASAFGHSIRVDWVAHERLRGNGFAEPVSEGSCDCRAVVGCGLPFLGVEVKVVDNERRSVSERVVGEVLIRSDQCFSGYYRRPDLSAQAMHEDWYCSGDLGYLVDGELFILGRKDDLIIVGGQNIQPQAIEELATNLLGRSGRLAVAFSLRDEALGTERPVLVCETRFDESEGQLADWRAGITRRVQDRLDVTLADIRFVPKGWVVQSDAKIGRAANREKYLTEGHQMETPGVALLRTAGDDPALLEQALTALFAEMLSLETVQPDDDFFALGGDSLIALRMLLLVEEATGKIIVTEFFHDPTASHLAQLLMARPEIREAPVNGSDSSPLARPTRKQARSFRGKLRDQFFTTGPVWRGYRYIMGVRLQRLLIAQPSFRRRFIRQQEVLEQWCQELGVEENRGQIITTNLLANTWLDWRRYAIMHIGIPNRWFRIADPYNALLERPLSPQGTVLAIPHVGRIMAELLEISKQNGYETGWISGARRVGTLNRSIMLWNAQQILRRGGVVMLAADGRQGNQAIDIPFWGRHRPFQIGAAELAVTTRATFVPVYTHFNSDGRVDVDITAPLVPQSTKPRDQIVELTERYGTEYAERWPQFFASMNWQHLEYNLNLPKS